MKSSSLTVAIAAVLACACANAQTLPHPTPSQDKLLSPQLLDRTRVFADTPCQPAASHSLVPNCKLRAPYSAIAPGFSNSLPVLKYRPPAASPACR